MASEHLKIPSRFPPSPPRRVAVFLPVPYGPHGAVRNAAADLTAAVVPHESTLVINGPQKPPSPSPSQSSGGSSRRFTAAYLDLTADFHDPDARAVHAGRLGSSSSSSSLRERPLPVPAAATAGGGGGGGDSGVAAVAGTKPGTIP